MRKAFVWLQYPRLIFANCLYRKSAKEICENRSVQSLIQTDALRYRSKKSEQQGKMLLDTLLLTNKVFRTQFYFRIEQSANLKSSCLKSVSKVILPPLDNVQIGINKTGFIGGGLFIVHSSGCVISAHRMGENATVFQGVTIGDSNHISDEGDKNPVIGNNVIIYANAVVAGGITIGDNVTIGAGSVVLKDVPSDCVVAGNPARIIRQHGEKTDIKL